MYGIYVPQSWVIDWEVSNDNHFHQAFSEYISEDNITNNDGIFCLSNLKGRDGKFMIIGKVLNRNEKNALLGQYSPTIVSTLNEEERTNVRRLINNIFDINGDFHYYFITKE